MTVPYAKLVCPECRTALKPAKPVPAGKKVKCPECAFVFAAPGALEPEVRMPKASPRKAVVKKPAAAKPAPKKPKGDDDEEDGGGTYAFLGEGHGTDQVKPDIEYAPDMSIKDLRGPAQAAVVRPSNWLIIWGVVGFLGWLGFLVILLIPIVFPLDTDDGKRKEAPIITSGLAAGALPGAGEWTPPRQVGEKKKDEDLGTTFFTVFGVTLSDVAYFEMWLMILSALPLVLCMVYSAVLTLGAVKMQNLESRGWGIASCIMVMLPINGGGMAALVAVFGQFFLKILFDEPETVNGIIGGLASLLWLGQVGVGVWALLTLRNPEVIAGYEYVAE
jgi:hypothetical protein